MAAKKPQPQVDASKVLVQQGVDAESSYLNSQTAKSDKQWLDETSQAWEARQTAEKAQDAAKSEGQAVINLADATGAVGEKTGASLIVADASGDKDKEAGVAVKKKDDDSNDKGGYIWGGLGVLGLIGIAAAGGGGGDSTPAATPLNIDGLVIDDPVANAIVFRDTHGDGYLHVIGDGEGRYIVDPDQALVVTNSRGEFADLGGSGRIISVGINRLPIKVYADSFNEINPDERVANEGDRLFASVATADADTAINNGELAFIVGENQIFDSLVISSGITLSVGGSNVTLVTGVTALVDAYVHRYEDSDFVPTDAQIKTAIIEVADLFGYELNANSSEQSLMSFLLGGYDVTGVDSPNNLNQEIYSIVNSLYATNEALNDEQYDAADFSMLFNQAMNAIILVQEERVRNEDQDLASLALNPELLGNVTEEFIQLFNQASEFDISDSDAQLYIDVARNHANLGGGAADIYETFDEGDQSEDDNLVNMVVGGEQMSEDEVELVGNITVLAAEQGDDVDLYLGEFGSSLDTPTPVELMGSNILISAYGEDSRANLDVFAINAPGTEMSNGTNTYDADSDETIALGDLTVQATGEDSSASLTMLGDLDIAGDISVTASGEDSTSGATLIAGSDSLGYYGDLDQGVAASAIFEVDLNSILDDALTTNRSVIQLIIDGKVLSANVNDFANNDEAIADIINQWNNDSDYATLSTNQIEYWGSYDNDIDDWRNTARIRFDDTASHEVEVNRFNGALKTAFVDEVDQIQDNVVREAAINFEGSHIEVIQSGNMSDYGSYDFNVSGLLVLGATGEIDGIDVITESPEFNYSYDYYNYPSALALINIDGSVAGEINVKTLEDATDKTSLLFLNASAGELNLDDVSINVTAEGIDSAAALKIGGDIYGLPLPGFGSLDVGSSVVTGTINGITLSASGYDSDASLDIDGDITIGGTILVETSAEDAYASLSLDSNYSSNDTLSSSAITFDNVDIIARAYGNDAEVDISGDMNANGSINSITLIAHADGALDGSDNAESADVDVDLVFNGTVGDITLQAIGHSDDVDLDMDASSNRSHGDEVQFYSLDQMMSNDANWQDLQTGDLVSLTIGDVVLTATVGQDVNDDYETAVEVLADVVSQLQDAVDARNADPLLSDLNVVIKQTGNTDDFDRWYGADGIWVRWLEAGAQEPTSLNVDGDILTPIDGEYGENMSTSIEFDNSDILVTANGESSDARVDINDATGRINSLTVLATADSADAHVAIELGGRLGDVTITADGWSTDAGVEIDTAPEGMIYDNSTITLNALGESAEVEFHQEGYGSGVIDTLTINAIGESADADVIIGGDITFESEINLYARNTGNTDDVDIYMHLANEDRDDGMNSTFHMNDVTINVEAVGNDARAEITTQNYAHADFDSDSSIDSKITGTINALNVYSGVYDESDQSINPTLVANAETSVDLNVHGIIESITLEADNVSEISVDLFGAINANGVMDITITNSNSSSISLDLHDVYGDIDTITSNSGSEGAETDIHVSTEGSIQTVNLTTTQDAETVASFDITGSQNYIHNLTITTVGTSFFGDYTSVSDVTIDQEAHGGVVNIVNGASNGYLLADTRLTYTGNYQADSIVIAANNNYDGPGDEFALHISMDDVDVYNTQHQTALVNNMTTVTGLVNGYYNPTNNYIQFADLEDADYTYEPGAVGQQGPINLNISHYSNGLDGWRGGLASGEDGVHYDDVEGSQNIGNGFYGSFNEFFDAAQFGIASEYAFIDLAQYGAAGTSGFDINFNTDVYLTVTWVDRNGASQTIYLNADLGDPNLSGNLKGDADRVVDGLNADTDWHENAQVTSEGSWSGSDNNVTVFANDNDTLGIRIGEGYITNVAFGSRWDETDDLSIDDVRNNQSIDDSLSKNYESLMKGADFGPDSIRYVEGGGYFFGMVLNTDQTTYRGILAMDEDGEGVTKLIELADVVASYNDVENFLDGDQSTDYGYDQFSTAYIGMAFGTEGGGDWAGYPGLTGFDYDTTADNYQLMFG